MSRVVLGVAGGIAAYKACELLRRLRAAGHDVTVVPTESALQFVGTSTWAALSGHPVSTSVWDEVQAVPHVKIGQEADLVVVAPATADLLARAAAGRPAAGPSAGRPGGRGRDRRLQGGRPAPAVHRARP